MPEKSQVDLISDLATHSNGVQTISHCTAIQMGQVEPNSEGGLVAETGLVNAIDPEIKTSDPNKRRGQIKISDYYSIKTHCTQTGPSYQSQ